MAWLYGTQNDDTLYGYAGQVNYIFGYGGHDRLFGADQTDYLYGGRGNDFLSGLAGNDYLYGDDGDDAFNGGAGVDYYSGGTGIDLAYFGWNTQTMGVSIDLSINQVQNDGFGNSETITGIENIEGSRFDDYIRGDGAANMFIGHEGNDFLFGGNNNDRLYGGVGDDRLYGNGGQDELFGGDGADQLYGGDDNDRLWGQEGDDYFRGGRGVDEMIGGAGIDRVSVCERDATQVAYVDLHLQKVLNDGFGNYEFLSDVEGAGSGTQFADAFYGSEGANQILGGRGDFINGRGGADEIIVYGAPATLDGGDGSDTLGFGRDMLVADGDGDGLADIVGASTGVSVNLALGQIINDGFGGSGTFTGFENLNGTAVEDKLVGDNNANRIQGYGGNDTLWGAGGNDSLLGGEGRDTLYGDDGADRLDGGEHDDILYGGGQDDTLIGGLGLDRLYGDDGNDILFGGNQGDLLSGGEGSDTFVFGTMGKVLLDVTPPSGSLGTIADFQRGDIIDLSSIDAKEGGRFSNPNDAFAFIGTRAFTGAAGQLRMQTDGKYTYLLADTDGDRIADFTIQLNGGHSLTANDLIL